MEEVAQEEGEAAGQGQEELPAPSQAVVPMEVDEEQAGNWVWGEITSWYLPEGLIFHCCLVWDVLLQLGCLILNNDVTTAWFCEGIYSVLQPRAFFAYAGKYLDLKA